MQPLQTQFLKIIHTLGKGIELFIVMRHYYLHGLINPNHPPESSWPQWSPEEEDLRLMLAVPLSPSPSPSETPESGSSSPRARCSSWQLSGTPSSNLKSRPDLASLPVFVDASKLLCFLQCMKCFLAGSSSSPAMKRSTLRNSQQRRKRHEYPDFILTYIILFWDHAKYTDYHSLPPHLQSMSTRYPRW